MNEEHQKRFEEHVMGKHRAWDMLEEFVRDIHGAGPTQIANHMAMMGVASPEHCYCDLADGEEDTNYPELVWIHKNHQTWNFWVWRAIRFHSPCMIQPLRRVFLRDHEVPDAIPEDDLEWGRIVSKPWGQELLDHFISMNPDPNWVHME